ncbi:MAG: 30S ribosomal protein S7 [Candidatus Aenigmarchaeota archaeon]|nr:30S ribosomal protein S7 [Candidatus Aenigmarchaeota archaeon]
MPEQLAAEQKAEVKPEQQKMLLFGKWDLSEVKVEDQGLAEYIGLKPVMVPRSSGRFGRSFITKKRVNIVERFITKLMVPGHRGKKHRMTSGRCTGNTATIYLAVERAFDIISERAKQNPVQVLVKAIENAATLEEIASYRLGGMVARRAVVTSPQRRLDITLKGLSQGIYASTFGRKKGLEEAIASELLAAYGNDKASHAIQERQRLEREAEGAR